jgi:hypothetical protein
MTNVELPWISREEVFARVSMETAIRTVQSPLKAGLTPASDMRRSIYNVDNDQLLVVPSQPPTFVGIKLVGVAPG